MFYSYWIYLLKYKFCFPMFYFVRVVTLFANGLEVEHDHAGRKQVKSFKGGVGSGFAIESTKWRATLKTKQNYGSATRYEGYRVSALFVIPIHTQQCGKFRVY